MSQDKPVSAKRTEAEREQRAEEFAAKRHKDGIAPLLAAFATQEVSQAVAAEREACAKAMCEFCACPENYESATFGDIWLHEVKCDPEDYRICAAAAIHSRTTDKGVK